MTFWTKVMEGRNGIDTINMALLFMVLLFNLITKLVYAPALAVVSLLCSRWHCTEPSQSALRRAGEKTHGSPAFSRKSLPLSEKPNEPFRIDRYHTYYII